jgi:hypothetical protein
LGGLLADLALDAESALLRDAQALPQPGWLPADPIKRLGVGAVLRVMAFRSRDEI